MISETFTQKVRRQIALENESRALGAERYRSARPLPWRDEVSSAEQEGDLPPGRQLVRLAIEPTAQAIGEFKHRALNGAAVSVDAADILCAIGDEEAAALTARVVMHSAAEGMMLTATALRVADAMIDHIQLLDLRQRSKKFLKTYLDVQGLKSQTKARRRNNRKRLAELGVDRTFTMKQRLRAGVKAIELLCDSTGLFVIDTTGFGKRRIRPTEAVHKWLEQQHARCELLSPIHLPMIVSPRPWSNPHKGGYITKTPGNRLIKQANRKYHEQLRDVDMPDVYAAVNAVQSTPWRINTRVYEVVKEIWDGGGLLGGLPERLPQPIPPRPDDGDEEAIARWKREAMNVYDANNKQVAQRIGMSQRLWIAEKFKDEPEIYYPHACDFRGRIYPNTRKDMIRVYHQAKELRLIVHLDTKGIDGRRQANAIAPNYIHSMDAAHLMAVANRCHADAIDLAVVHDSFGCLANRAFEMRGILREEFVRQYRPDRLAELREELLAQLPDDLRDKLPPLPPMGDLDIEAIQHSEYLFA